MNEFKQRLKMLDALQKKCDAVLLFNQDPFKDKNFYYFSGSDPAYSFFIYDFSEAKIITNELELPKIQNESWIKNIIITKKYSKTLKKELKGYKKIGISANFPYFLARKLRHNLIDVSDELLNIRAIKSKNEIKNIRYACKISDKIMEKIATAIRPNISEAQLIQLIKTEILKHGCNLPPFEPIVNSGAKTSIPHDTAPNRRLGKNDLVMADISCIYNNYYSDCTRMFFTGEINRQIKQQYELLINTLNQAADSIHIGIKAEEVDVFIRKKLGKYAKNLIHASGHGLGLLPHEYPKISPNSNQILKENMVFALEPALYFKNYGLRIEDTVLLTRKRIKILTRVKK